MSDPPARPSSRKSCIYFGWAGTSVSPTVLSILEERFDVRFARHLAFGESVDQASLAATEHDFLFSFGPLIVGRPMLEAVNIAPINFHTAPPKWPGRGSCSWALLNGDDAFGVTAHIMAEEVDAGPILRVDRFPICPDDTAEALHERTLAAIPGLVLGLIDDLATNDWRPLPNGDRWKRKAIRQRELIAAMEIVDADTPETAQRKIRAFAHSSKNGPYIEKHGVKFWRLAKTP